MDTAQKVISQASNWNFEGDCMILNWMEQISKNLEDRANTTIQSLDRLKINVNRAQIDLENTQNSLTALQYSQYVEMRCQEETTSEAENATKDELQQQQKPTSQQEVLTVFLQNNVSMLHNCHDKFNFMEESDEDDSNMAAVENCIYQPRNPYNERLLPHIYGTKMWKEQSHVGLEDETFADDSGDEKSEVYSISSTSSVESEGRESPVSHLTANTSQYTSSASLNKEFNNGIKTPKSLPSISNTPSVSSLPLDTTVRRETTDLLPEAAATLQPSSSLKKPTLNLFDDNDYKNLMSEIVEKTQSAEKTKQTTQIQADNSKVDLFADDDPLPPVQIQTQTRNSVKTQQIPSVNLFDSPTEPTKDLFQNLTKPALSATATQIPASIAKLSTRNLFDDDDEDDDTDFLNIFAKKAQGATIATDAKPLNINAPKSLFDDDEDELDRQETVQAQISKATVETLPKKNVSANITNPTQSKNSTKSLFFDDDDDDDDFFVKKSVQSNITKSIEQPKNNTFPAYLSTEPPEDIGTRKIANDNQKKTHKELSFEADVEADDDNDEFLHIFDSKQQTKKIEVKKTESKIVSNLLSQNENTQNVAANASKEERVNEANETNKSEPLSSITASDEKIKILAEKNEDLKKSIQSEIDIRTDESLVKENHITEANKPKSSTLFEETSDALTESEAELKTAKDRIPKLFEKTEFYEATTENTSAPKTISFNSSAWLTEPPLDEQPQESPVKDAKKQIAESVVFEDETVEEDDFLSMFQKKSPTISKEYDKNESLAATEKEQPNVNTNVVENLPKTQQEILEINLKPKETNPIIETAENNASNKIEASNTIFISSDITPEIIQTANQETLPAFDHFSPLFLDEPPDDDDFLQAISSSSSSNVVPTTQYSAESDFYETAQQNQITEMKTDESPQIHTGYNIRLFDELPPDDNEQEDVRIIDVPILSKQNTLNNLFATDEFSNFLDDSAPEAESDIFAKNSTAQQPKSVTAKVQAIEKPLSKEETVKSPSANVSKLKLPKIEINVQALLPNAGGVKPTKRVIETEKLADENAQKYAENTIYQAETTNTPTLPIPITKNYVSEPENAHLLPSLCKNRVKVPVKRKSSTRAGRQESYRQTIQTESNENILGNNLLTSGEKFEEKKSVQSEKIDKLQVKPIKQVLDNIPAAVIPQAQTSNKPLMTVPNQTTTAKNIKQAPTTTLPKVPTQASTLSSSLFGNIDDNNDGHDDFFSTLAQPKLPTPANKKAATIDSPISKDSDSDDDLFAKAGTTLAQPKPLASSQSTVSNKAVSVTTKPIEKSVPKKKALFDSDSEDESTDNLFKASKTSKSTLQATTKAPSAVNALKASQSQKLQSKSKSLFSDSDEDDDDLFGSSASKPKKSLTCPPKTTATSDPLATKQLKSQKDMIPSSKPADNPLADLLE